MPLPVMRRGRERLWTWAFLGLAALGWPAPRPVLAGSRRTPVVEAVQKVQPSVVSISSEKKAASTNRWPFSAEESQRPRVSGMGTGVILDGRGYILTNHHVVDKVQGIEVHLADGTVFPARLLQFDEAMDLAMLKVDAGRPLPAITLGTSADLMVGEDVITIGNAFGYENTVSIGIISALNRNVTLSDEQVYRNLVQTDACINPGNSGGPLINVDGELIGINVAVRAGAQGIGFALPIDDVKAVAREMMSTRRLAGTWHGLVAVESRTGPGRAVVLSEVQPGSPAEMAGFRPGDQVVCVGDLKVTTPLDIERGLIDVAPGQKAQVVVRRGTQDQALPIEPQSLPRALPDAADQVWRMLGLKTTPVSPEYVVAASPKLRGGLYIQAVSPNSPGAHASIQKGDILVGMNVGLRHWETIQPDNILFILRQSEVAQSQTMQFYIVRRNNIHQGTMSLAGFPASNLLSR
ncbi:MAG: trypsin-like peptidase domain-containing protein [Planctomycetaceae bacterium]|nr:trypsin-like peptidase domain-containing protein [Planctomycetaceae bacterium]